MELNTSYDIELSPIAERAKLQPLPQNQIDPTKAKFPWCLVWTPFPVVSWLAPFFGHVGICREDGAVIDFSGSHELNVDNFRFGPVARYVQLDPEQCCFPPNLSAHKCKDHYRHVDLGTALTWDQALQSSMREYETKTHNIFTCNCHSFVANCLNRMCYGRSMDWNMVTVAALILYKGHCVGFWGIVRSFLPFVAVACSGVLMVGWPFLLGLLIVALLVFGWFVLATYLGNITEC
ncbi:unnamed protein product [Sphenostylis stenocarpa]|uniref:Protein REVERSION-TO-ETHYLENE SENSITIVITY1 n=1 Tax=Sphenostylis stenocarpa TaxID=92480 RepID=A0AA86SU84_9FABA|nr:unnamed protein product [Sphenostylis stenocarpa]